jgi:hypothetical protein
MLENLENAATFGAILGSAAVGAFVAYIAGSPVECVQLIEQPIEQYCRWDINEAAGSAVAVAGWVITAIAYVLIVAATS